MLKTQGVSHTHTTKEWTIPITAIVIA